MTGEAGLSYVDYEARDSEKKLLSGNSLAQKYSIDYTASNRYSAFDQRYYNVSLGYEWLDFNTTVNDGEDNSALKLHQSFGKFKYSGEILYVAPSFPAKFKAYSRDYQYSNFDTGLIPNGGSTVASPQHSSIYGDQLVNDGLYYGINGLIKSVTTGVEFVFDPSLQRMNSLYGLPKFMFDYRESTNKGTERFFSVDNRTRELAVAGLNKENNWLQFRSVKFENFLAPLDRYERNTLIVGLIDNVGRRKWTSLTNWIDVSADGRFSVYRTPTTDRNSEEYDANFFAIASRQSWEAKTFLNFNRLTEDNYITETARIPVYLKGIYGRDISWYSGVSVQRGRRLDRTTDTIDSSYVNNVTLGGTAFERSEFTLSPSINFQSDKAAFSSSSYSFQAAVEANSTRRFSEKAGLAAKVYWRNMDSGSGSSESSTWAAGVDLKSRYKPDSRLVFSLEDSFEFGDGQGFIDPLRLQAGVNIGAHYKNRISLSAFYTPTAFFSTSISGSYDYIKSAGLPLNTEADLQYRISYVKDKFDLRADSSFKSIDNGVNYKSDKLTNRAVVSYRPDRNHDASLTYTHRYEHSAMSDFNDIEFKQKYSYNFFTRDGVARNIATFSQEYSFLQSKVYAGNRTTQYLMLSGRYSPTSRLSLYGGLRSQWDETSRMTLFYNGGLTADFKLLSTSLDYTYAKRDGDNRIEKRLAASVKRTF